MSANRNRQSERTVRNIVRLLLDEKKPLSPLEISQKLGVNVNSIPILNDFPELFEKIKDGQLRYKLEVKLTLCEEHCDNRKNCKSKDCMGLHLCRFYMTSGKCKYDQGNCSYGHDLATPHNRKILENKFLDGLPIDSIRCLLNQTGSFHQTGSSHRTGSSHQKGSSHQTGSSHRTGSSHQTGSSHKGKTPMVCKYYNESECRNTEKCPYLHLCKDYVDNICRKGKECPKSKSHDVLDKDVKAILEKLGISTQRPPKEIIGELRDAVSGKGGSGTKTDKTDMKLSAKMETMTLAKQDTAAPAKAGANQTSDSKKGGYRPKDKKGQDSEISTQLCFFNLRGKCAYKDSCRNFHGDLPYQWQYKLPSNEDWNVFPSDVNIDTEQKYSDPKNAGCKISLTDGVSLAVTFKFMTGTDEQGNIFDVRRLSTASSVEFEREPLTTVWVWYWKDRDWTKYGDVGKGFTSNITNTDLEQAYIENPDGKKIFETSVHKYMVDFQKMLQINLNPQFATEREVCRRPVFVSKQEAEERKKEKKKQMDSEKGDAASSVVPRHWTMKSGADITSHYALVKVEKDNPLTQSEYKEIETLFVGSFQGPASIKSIERIENGDLWEDYVSKRNKMYKKCGNKDVGERRLFHGTRSDYVEAICRQGFDFRLSGRSVGTLYGKGSYFATTSNYSDMYTSSSDRAMFVVKVMTGEYTQGEKEYSRPPNKDNDRLYDSCVNNVSNPSIFVIFDLHQVYPEYLIKYDKP